MLYRVTLVSHKRFSGARRAGTIQLTRGDVISQTSFTAELSNGTPLN